MEDHPRPWLKMGKPPFWGRKSTSSFQAAERQSSRDEKNTLEFGQQQSELKSYAYVYIYMLVMVTSHYLIDLYMSYEMVVMLTTM